MRRAFAAAASAALVATGLTVSVGVGAAGAAEAAEAETDAVACSQTSHRTKKNASTWGVTHTYDKTVTTAEAAPGSEVTYKIVVGTTGIGNPYLSSIIDYPPDGFGAPVKATVRRFTAAAAGQSTHDVTLVPSGSGYKMSSTGIFMNASNSVTMQVTYKVPDDVPVGSTVTSGGIKTGGTVGIGHSLPGVLTACFTVRAPNPGETVTGSLDDSGLGSSDGQLSSTGSISDVLGDTIGRAIQSLS